MISLKSFSTRSNEARGSFVCASNPAEIRTKSGLCFSNFLIILSLRLGEASKLAPLGYFEISTNILVGYAFFGDLPDIWIYLGLSLIVFSGIYIFIRERREIKKTN